MIERIAFHDYVMMGVKNERKHIQNKSSRQIERFTVFLIFQKFILKSHGSWLQTKSPFYEKKTSRFTFHWKKNNAIHESRIYPLPPSYRIEVQKTDFLNFCSL